MLAQPLQCLIISVCLISHGLGVRILQLRRHEKTSLDQLEHHEKDSRRIVSGYGDIKSMHKQLGIFFLHVSFMLLLEDGLQVAVVED